MNCEAPVPSRDAARYRRWIRRRRSHYPIQYLLGEWGFWQDSFLVGPGVLVPRPETELLVETAVEKLATRNGERLNILELGVGSGALILSLLREFSNSRGFGMDRERQAIDWAARNAVRLEMKERVSLWRGDLAEGVALRRAFDLVVFNPPYLTSDELRKVQREVRFEPREALDGGPDGMRFYLASVADLQYVTRPDGWLMMEVSPLRADKVCRVFTRSGWQDVEVRRDLAGRKRIVCGRKGSMEAPRG